MHGKVYNVFFTAIQLPGGPSYKDTWYPNYSFIEFDKLEYENIYCFIANDRPYYWMECVAFMVIYDNHKPQGKQFSAKILE